MYTPGDDVRRRRCATTTTTTTTKRGRDRRSGGADCCCCKVDEIQARAYGGWSKHASNSGTPAGGSGHPVTDGARRGEAIERTTRALRARALKFGSDRIETEAEAHLHLSLSYDVHPPPGEEARQQLSRKNERSDHATPPEKWIRLGCAPRQGASPAQGGTGTGEEVAGRRSRGGGGGRVDNGTLLPAIRYVPRPRTARRLP
jgi:hypothetical protein